MGEPDCFFMARVGKGSVDTGDILGRWLCTIRNNTRAPESMRLATLFWNAS